MTWEGEGFLPIQPEKYGTLFMDFCSKRMIWVLVVGAFLVVTAFQGTRGLYETTEGRYAECARETMLSDEWDDPVLNNQPHWTKPPLTYWAIMVGLKTLGVNTWGARAYLVPCFLVSIFCAYWIGSLMWNRQAGLVSALVYAASPMTLFSSNAVSTDGLLACLVALALACFWKSVYSRSFWSVAGMWFFWALAFLTKGPPALLPAVGVIAAVILMRRRQMGDGSTRSLTLYHLVGFGLFLVVGLSWYIAEGIEHPGLMNYWVKDEVIARNLSDEFHRNPEFYKGFAIYWPSLIFGTAPWSFIALWRYRHLFRRDSFRQTWKALLASPEWFWMVSTVVLVLVIFMISKSKLMLYILPLWIPLSLMSGRALASLLERKQLSCKILIGFSLFLWLGFVGYKVGAPVLGLNKDMKILAIDLVRTVGRNSVQRLYVMGERPLNGLSFYLKRPLPTIEDEDLPVVLKNIEFGEKPIYLVSRNRSSDKLGKYLTSGFEVKRIPLNKHWAVYEVLPEMASTPPTGAN
jgi:4-amino-4-deoxy-L-arabinose transferase